MKLLVNKDGKLTTFPNQAFGFATIYKSVVVTQDKMFHLTDLIPGSVYTCEEIHHRIDRSDSYNPVSKGYEVVGEIKLFK